MLVCGRIRYAAVMTVLEPVSWSRPARPARSVLVHRNVDAWLIGGISLVLFALMFVVVPRDADINSVSWTAFYLAFVVNGPHFFASYWHLYVDNGRDLLRNRRYVFAGIVVPIALIVGLFVASRRPSEATLASMVNIMWISVGWHYVKQIFGVSLVASAAHGRPIGGLTKSLYRINLLSVWLMTLVFSNDRGSKTAFFGVTSTSFDLTGWLERIHLYWIADHLRLVVYVIVGVTALAAIGGFVRQWIRTGKTMAPVGWIAWLSIYVWYLPVFYHPSYGYLIPFFHSLQYLLFSVTFSWNKSRRILEQPTTVTATDDRIRRRRFVEKFGLFVAVSVVLGAAGFHWIPEWLDRNATLRPTVLGPQFYVVAFNLFINIHHYFVDSVIWRGSNPQVRTFLRPRPVS